MAKNGKSNGSPRSEKASDEAAAQSLPDAVDKASASDEAAAQSPRDVVDKAQSLPDAMAQRPSTVEIVMRRKMRCGENDVDVGHKIGSVVLEPGVTLNYLVAALHNGYAGGD